MKYLYLTIILLYFVLCNACTEEPQPMDNNFPDTSEGVFVLNEGTFTFGNASVSFIDKDGEVHLDLFEQANSRKLGDVAQSMFFYQDQIFIVVNNSGKIEVVDASTFQSVGQFTDLWSPRYLQPISDQEAVLSHFKRNQLDRLDLDQFSVQESLLEDCESANEFDCGLEEIFQIDSLLFVQNKDQNALFVYHYSSSSSSIVLLDQIEFEAFATDVLQDAQGNLWILASELDSSEGWLYQIAASDYNLVESWPLENIGTFTNILAEHAGQLYLATGAQVLKLEIEGSQIQGSSLFEADQLNIYGMAVDPAGDFLYLSDALDFTQQGLVFRWDLNNHKMLDTIRVGIIPSKFYFK